MIANVSAHRRANAFAQALEDQSDQGTAAEQPDGSAPSQAASEQTEQGLLLALATGLGELPKPELDPEVKVVQRAQLVAAMEAMLLEGTAAGAKARTVPCPGNARTGHGAHTGRPDWGSCDRVRVCPRAWPRAGSPWAWPREPSAAWQPPAPTPCPVTRSTGSNEAWRTSNSAWPTATATAASSTSTRRPHA